MSDNDHNPIYGDPFDVLIAHFEAHGIRYSSKREERRAWFTMNSGTALQKCTFFFNKNGHVLQIRIQYPIMVKEQFRPAVMEFITRANYGLVIGNFEMDCSDGEVRYHISHLMEEGRLEDETIKRLFSTGLGTADRYFPALMRVLFAGETPEDAVDLAELDKFEPEEESTPKKAPAPKAKGKARKSGSKRSRKAPEITQSPTPSKPEDHPACESQAQPTPPPIPPHPAPGPENQSGQDGEEGRKAA